MLSVRLCCCFIQLFITIPIVQGKYVYQPKLQRWIARDIIVATWEEAQHHCESQGATLASPTDTELLKYMKSIIEVNNHTTPYFIGIKARHRAQLQFVSEEGILLEDLSEAAQNMIERLDPRDGDCLCMDRNSIRVVPCWRRLPYMCYKNANDSATDTPTTDTDILSSTEPTQTDVPVAVYDRTSIPLDGTVDCGSGYKLYASGSCYKVHKEDVVTWDTANSTCTAEGGYLVIVNDKFEAQRLVEEIFGFVNDESDPAMNTFWIGFEKPTGTDISLSVKGDEDNDFVPVWNRNVVDPDCAFMDQSVTGVMADMFCRGHVHPFICEKDLN